MQSRICFTAALLAFLMLGASFSTAADIRWTIYLRPYMSSGAILEKTTREGEEFTVRASECRHIPSETGEIVGALDGTSFMLGQSPSRGTLEIRIILNVRGNTFETVSGISLFLNMTLEAYEDGVRADHLDFSRSPLVMTIPSSGLSYLLSASNLSRTNLICVYRSGSTFTDDGIDTTDGTSRMVVRMSRFTQTLGGIGTDLGIESRVKYDTWSTIKLLFR